jgi:predicted transcriptional regulator
MTPLSSHPPRDIGEIGEAVGITERAAHRIVSELAESGYISRERHGRRNRSTVRSQLPVPDPVARHQKIGDLPATLAGSSNE